MKTSNERFAQGMLTPRIRIVCRVDIILDGARLEGAFTDDPDNALGGVAVPRRLSALTAHQPPSSPWGNCAPRSPRNLPHKTPGAFPFRGSSKGTRKVGQSSRQA